MGKKATTKNTVNKKSGNPHTGLQPELNAQTEEIKNENNSQRLIEEGNSEKVAIVISDKLKAGNSLQVTQYIMSKNGKYKMIMQDNGNLVILRIEDNFIIWSTGTGESSAKQVLMTTDGNLVVYTEGELPDQSTEVHMAIPQDQENQTRTISQPEDSANRIGDKIQSRADSLDENKTKQLTEKVVLLAKKVWESDTKGYSGACLQLQYDGTAVITLDSKIIWAQGVKLLPRPAIIELLIDKEYPVSGLILTSWNKFGGKDGVLGKPKGPASTPFSNGETEQLFQYGSIKYSPNIGPSAMLVL